MNINEIKHNLKTNIPVFKAGDTVRVKVKANHHDKSKHQKLKKECAKMN